MGAKIERDAWISQSVNVLFYGCSHRGDVWMNSIECELDEQKGKKDGG